MKLNAFLIALPCLLILSCGGKTPASSSTSADSLKITAIATNSNTVAAPSGRYKSGDALYVYANSGLVLREKPDPSGAKVTSVPLYGMVKVTDAEPFKLAFSTKEACGLEIKGHWVKATYGDKEGYLFDGYLLKHKPLSDEGMEPYWTAISKVKSSTDKPPKNDVNYYSYKFTEWENGVKYREEGYEGGSTSVLTVPKSLFTFQEAYLFGTAGINNDKENPTTCTCDAVNSSARCVSEDDLSQTEIVMNANGDFEITDAYAD